MRDIISESSPLKIALQRSSRVFSRCFYSSSLSNVIFTAFFIGIPPTGPECAPYSLCSFFLIVLPKRISSSGTSWPACLITCCSSPACPLSPGWKNV